MGASSTLARALALHVAQRGRFSLELSLAAVFSLGSRTVRGGRLRSLTRARHVTS